MDEFVLWVCFVVALPSPRLRSNVNSVNSKFSCRLICAVCLWISACNVQLTQFWRQWLQTGRTRVVGETNGGTFIYLRLVLCGRCIEHWTQFVCCKCGWIVTAAAGKVSFSNWETSKFTINLKWDVPTAGRTAADAHMLFARSFVHSERIDDIRTHTAAEAAPDASRKISVRWNGKHHTASSS